MRRNVLLVMILLVSLVQTSILISLLVGGVLFFNKVEPIIDKAELMVSKLESFELPDLSMVNALVVKADRVIELVDKLPFDKVGVFNEVWARLDEVNATDLLVETLPSWSQYYTNGSWRVEK